MLNDRLANDVRSKCSYASSVFNVEVAIFQVPCSFVERVSVVEHKQILTNRHVC